MPQIWRVQNLFLQFTALSTFWTCSLLPGLKEKIPDVQCAVSLKTPLNFQSRICSFWTSQEFFWLTSYEFCISFHNINISHVYFIWRTEWFVCGCFLVCGCLCGCLWVCGCLCVSVCVYDLDDFPHFSFSVYNWCSKSMYISVCTCLSLIACYEKLHKQTRCLFTFIAFKPHYINIKDLT